MSNLAFLPQIIRSFRRKKVDDISIGMFAVLFITQLCWIGYSIPIHARQLWTSSLTEIILLIPVFILWTIYRTPKAKPWRRKLFFWRTQRMPINDAGDNPNGNRQCVPAPEAFQEKQQTVNLAFMDK
jgi:MtN3 and saliva related transmembrane protein